MTLKCSFENNLYIKYFVEKIVDKNYKLRVCLVEGVEKWEDEKLVGGWKIGRIEKFWFFLISVWLKGWKGGRWKIFLFGLREKWEDGKCSLYELTIM